MSTTEPLRLALVGCGAIAQTHGKAALAEPETVRLVACCDVRREAADAFAARFACAAYDDLDAMLSAQRPDAVLLATYPNQHLAQIRRCLAAGVRAILCEKALATDGAEALEMLRAARAAGALVSEGFMYRHHPALAKLDELVAAGAVGRVGQIAASFSCVFPIPAGAEHDPTRNWRLRRDAGGGVPHDFTCYAVDACNHFAGAPPVRVMAHAALHPALGIIQRLSGLIEYANGRIGMIESSHVLDESQRLEIAGDGGRLTLPCAWTNREAIHIRHRRSTGWMLGDEHAHQVPASDPYRLQLRHFAAAARGAAPPRPALEESVICCCTIAALVASGLERRMVEVALPPEVAPLAGPAAS